jgi:peptidoglycan hydrolase-like protein with peptidoglycan-binding domain
VTNREIVALQQSLNQSGFSYKVLGEALKEDGIYGPETDRAYRVWLDKMCEILAEVEAGTRPVPMSLTEIAADLPALTWEGA